MKIGNHITKVRSRPAVEPAAIQPVVMWTPALGHVKEIIKNEKNFFNSFIDF